MPSSHQVTYAINTKQGGMGFYSQKGNSLSCCFLSYIAHRPISFLSMLPRSLGLSCADRKKNIVPSEKSYINVIAFEYIFTYFAHVG